MKKLLNIICLIAFLLIAGCEGNGEKPKLRLKGFSVGAIYLNTNFDLGYGQSAQIREIMPIGMLNFEF